MKIIIIASLLFSINSFGHGDHTVPGSIPAAPHGGVVREAVHQHAGSLKHDHGHAAKKEIFYEGVLKKNILNIYLLELDSKSYKSFVQQKPTEVKSVTAFDPRKKKNYTLDVKLSEGKLSADFSKIKGR
ncbi:MAG: hypothetical protein HON90_18260, partial [Halobacteriovoraceae bacterium]|nr:hypothetical protein [Halobacteriovoraceae bacterium]